MTGLPRHDHVGITVSDLDAAVDFFVGLGLQVEGRMSIEGDFLDTVCGLRGARTEIAMLVPPGGGSMIELSSFGIPDVEPGDPAAMANVVGLRNVCFEIEDLRGTVDRLASQGFGLVGGVGEHEGQWLMAYVRGPDGIVVSLAERIG